MKKIGIDGRLISQTGVGVYIRNLLYYSSRRIPKNWRVYLYLIDDDFKNFHFPYPHPYIKRRAPFRWHSFAEQLDFAHLLYRDNLDLVHFTYFTYPWLYRKKFISTIHDLTPLLFKTGKASTGNRLIFELKHFIFRQVLKSEISRAVKVITPTNTIKKQIISLFGEHLQRKIIPLAEGVDYQLFNLKANNKLKKVFKKPFFVYIGNFYPHKNVSNLIRVFSQIKKDVSLILVGPDNFFAKRLQQISIELWKKKKIIFYPNASKSDLVFFYQNALALIHPSLSEGFGLTIIEALYFGCPVIASDIPVFDELYRDNFIRFNPYRLDSLKEVIESFLQKKLIHQVDRVIFNKLSFERMANETINLYQEVLS